MKKRMLIAGLLALSMLLIACGSGAEEIIDESSAESSAENVIDVSGASSAAASFAASSLVSESSEEDESGAVSDDASVPDEESGDESEVSQTISGDESEAQSEESQSVSEESSKPSEQSKEPPKETSSETSKNPQQTGSSHTHSYKTTVVEPTCTEKGYTLHKCSCGDSYKDKETDALGHYWVAVGASDPQPTDTTRGKQKYKCWNGCGSSETRELYSNNEYSAMLVPRVLDWLNKYRAKEGAPAVILSNKLTEFSQYRAKQLTTNFAHSFEDACAAAEATHCGAYYSDYIDPNTGEFVPAHWGGEGYGEVIARLSSSEYLVVGDEGKVDSVAKQIIDLFWESSAHHAILAERPDFTIYVGIGVYRGHVCISLSSHNQDDTGYVHYWYDDDGIFHYEYVKE